MSDQQIKELAMAIVFMAQSHAGNQGGLKEAYNQAIQMIKDADRV